MFFVKSILRSLTRNKQKLVQVLLANKSVDIISIANENRDIAIVIFLGHLSVPENDDPFMPNIVALIKLREILPRSTVMIAATGHFRTDVTLCKNGCLIRDDMGRLVDFLQDTIC